MWFLEYAGAMNHRILCLFTAVALLGCPSGPADFRVLAEKAYPEDGTQDRQALNKLWTALFKLPQWHLLMTQKTAGQKQPSVEMIDGEPVWLVFTDLQMLKAYALSKAAAPVADGGVPQFVFAVAQVASDGGPNANPYLAPDGTVLWVSMTPDAARAFFAAHQGVPVSSIRFNEGTRKGWFAPLKAVESIHEMLKANAKL